jgi:hypothetical protein
VPAQRISGEPPNGVSLRAPQSRRGAVALSAAVTVLWALAVFGSTRIHVDRYVHHLAVVLHLLSLTFGFGSVLAVDLCGLAGLRRRRDFALADAVRTAAVVDLLIWVGYLGLILSGLLLRPDLNSPLMWVKLGAALVAGLNGVNARRVMAAMSVLPRSARLADLPRPFACRAVAAALVSQAAWWTAILIGFFGA